MTIPAYNAYLDGQQVPGDGYQFVLDVSRPDDQRWRELFLPSLVRTVRYRRGVDDPLACRSAKPCAYEPRRLAERLEARVDCYARHGLAYADEDASRVLRELWRTEETTLQTAPIAVEPVHTINVHPKLRRLHMARRKSVSATPKAARKQATPAVTKPVKAAATKGNGGAKARTGVISFIKDEIMKNVPRDKIVTEIGKRFPDSKMAGDEKQAKAGVAWCRQWLKKDGQTLPANHVGRQPKAA